MRKPSRSYSPYRKPDPKGWKPRRFQHYFTMAEVCFMLKKDPSWIRRLERDPERMMPEPKRVQHGKLSVRLYSPGQVEELRQIFSQMKRGRPKGGSNAKKKS